MTDTNLAPQRDERGFFLPGNKVGKGHGGGGQHHLVAQLRRTFYESVGTDKLREVVAHHLDLIQKASPKDAAALLDLLYSYLLGKPVTPIAMDLQTTDATPRPNAPASSLDAVDIAALERIRDKLTGGPVFDVEPEPEPNLSN